MLLSSKTTRTMLLCGVCVLVWCASTADVYARQLAPELPSVEVNLGALRQLKPEAPSHYQPVKPAPVVQPKPVVPATAPGVTKPVMPEVIEVPRAPMPEKSAPDPYRVPVAKPVPAPVAPSVALPPTPPMLLPAPPAPKVAPAPVALPAPMSAQPAMVVETVKPVEPFVPAPLPASPTPVAKPAPLPAPPVTQVVPPVMPAPVMVPAAPLKAGPSEGLKPGSSVSIPLMGASGVAPMSRPPEPEKPAASIPLVLPPLPATEASNAFEKVKKEKVTKDKSAKAKPTKQKPTKEKPASETKINLSEAPAISDAPMMIPVPAPANDLPPSVKARIAKEFAPEPKQQGILRDVKTIKNPIEEKAKADAAAKHATEATEKAARDAAAPVTPVDAKPLMPELPPMKPVGSDTKDVPKLPELPAIKPAQATKNDASMPSLPLPATPPSGKLPAKAADATLPELPAISPAQATKNDTAPALAPALSLPALPEVGAHVPKKEEAKLPELPTIKPEQSVKKQAPIALPQPSVLPMPMPPIGGDVNAAVKPELSAPLPEPVKMPSAKAPLPEKLPPAELPPQAAVPMLPELPAVGEKKPISLPKTEIATLPKLGAAAPTPLPLPELPKPPTMNEAPAKQAGALPELPLPKSVEAPKLPEPAKAPAAVKPENAITPPLPKLPVENTLQVPAKPPLPSLDAIIGNPPRSGADIIQPKDGIESKPLGGSAMPPQPALPKFPAVTDTQKAANGLPPLPLPEVKTPTAKVPEVKMSSTVKPPLSAEKPTVPAAAPALPLPPITAPVASSLPPLPAIKPEAEKPASIVANTTAAATADTLARSVSYAKGKSDLSNDEKSNLDAIADKVKQGKGTVRVVAYASGTAEESSVAKRTSLARALQIRAHLISKGVDAQSISTQAMGNKTEGNADRADVFVK